MQKWRGREKSHKCRQPELLLCMMEAALAFVPPFSASQTPCLKPQGRFLNPFRQNLQLKEAKRKRRKEEDREKRKQREELARIREAEAQSAHEAALAAIQDQPPEEAAGALRSPDG